MAIFFVVFIAALVVSYGASPNLKPCSDDDLDDGADDESCVGKTHFITITTNTFRVLGVFIFAYSCQMVCLCLYTYVIVYVCINLVMLIRFFLCKKFYIHYIIPHYLLPYIYCRIYFLLSTSYVIQQLEDSTVWSTWPSVQRLVYIALWREQDTTHMEIMSSLIFLSVIQVCKNRVHLYVHIYVCGSLYPSPSIHTQINICTYILYLYRYTPYWLSYNHLDTPLTSAARICVSLLVAFSYPLLCNPGRTSFLCLWRMLDDSEVELSEKTVNFRFIVSTVSAITVL